MTEQALDRATQGVGEQETSIAQIKEQLAVLQHTLASEQDEITGLQAQLRDKSEKAEGYRRRLSAAEQELAWLQQAIDSATTAKQTRMENELDAARQRMEQETTINQVHETQEELQRERAEWLKLTSAVCVPQETDDAMEAATADRFLLLASQAELVQAEQALNSATDELQLVDEFWTGDVGNSPQLDSVPSTLWNASTDPASGVSCGEQASIGGGIDKCMHAQWTVKTIEKWQHDASSQNDIWSATTPTSTTDLDGP